MPSKSKPVSHSSSASAPAGGGGHGKKKHATLPFAYPSATPRGAVVVNAPPEHYGVFPTGRGSVVVRAAPAGHRGAVRVIAPLTPEERRLFGPMYEWEADRWDPRLTRPWRRSASGGRRTDDGRRHLISVDGLGQTADTVSTTPIAGLVAVGFIAAGIFWAASSRTKVVANKRRMHRNRLSEARRSHIAKSAFVFPERRAWPLDTPQRAYAAIQMLKMGRVTSASDYHKITQAIRSRYPDVWNIYGKGLAWSRVKHAKAKRASHPPRRRSHRMAANRRRLRRNRYWYYA